MATRSLHAVPALAERAIVMTRVSDEGDRGDDLKSPEIQDRATGEHCERHGYVIVDRIVGVEKKRFSGSAARSRWWAKLDQAIEAVERGEADVLVVWKFSRVARERLKWATAIHRVEAAGGRIESATEPVDASPTGRLSRGVVGELNAYQAELIGESWKETHRLRLEYGRPANGKPRWGYTYDVEQKLHRPDEELGRVLESLYRRYIAGESIYQLVRWLNNNGYTTSPGYSEDGPGRWSDRSLRRVLDSGFAAGLLRVNVGTTKAPRYELRPGAHEALIDAETWEAYQAARAARRVTRSSERSQYLLSGLVRCACGSSMTGGQFGHARAPKYRCKAARETGAHDGGYVMAHLVEAEVLAFLRDVADEVGAATDAAAASAATAVRRRTDAEMLGAELGRLREQLTTATRKHMTGFYDDDAFLVVRDELREQIAALEARKLIAAVDSRKAAAPALARELLRDWDLLSVEQRRGGLRGLVGVVRVTPGRPLGKVDVVPVWAMPDPG